MLLVCLLGIITLGCVGMLIEVFSRQYRKKLRGEVLHDSFDWMLVFSFAHGVFVPLLLIFMVFIKEDSLSLNIAFTYLVSEIIWVVFRLIQAIEKNLYVFRRVSELKSLKSWAKENAFTITSQPALKGGTRPYQIVMEKEIGSHVYEMYCCTFDDGWHYSFSKKGSKSSQVLARIGIQTPVPPSVLTNQMESLLSNTQLNTGTMKKEDALVEFNPLFDWLNMTHV